MSTNDTLRGLLAEHAVQLRKWADESRNGGWSTHQVDPMRAAADRIDAALAEPVSADPMAMLDLRVEARKASPWGEHADRTGAFVKGALWHAMLNGGAVAERDAQAGEVKP